MHMSGYSGCFRKFCLLVLFSVWGSTQAMAAQPPGEKPYLAAIAQFEEVAQKAAKSGQVPRISDPAVSAIVSAMTDVKLLFGDQRFDGSDLPDLLEICKKTEKPTEIYGFADLSPEEHEATSGSTEASLEVIKRAMSKVGNNIRTYQDEIVPFMEFSLRCQTAVMKIARDYMASLTPEERTWDRLKNIGKVLPGDKSTLGFVLIAKDASFSLANRQRILRVIAGNADIYAQAMSENKRKLGAQIFLAKHAEFDQTLDADLKKIIAAFSVEGCVELCAYADQ